VLLHHHTQTHFQFQEQNKLVETVEVVEVVVRELVYLTAVWVRLVAREAQEVFVHMADWLVITYQHLDQFKILRIQM
jgi:hypothetical protein